MKYFIENNEEEKCYDIIETESNNGVLKFSYPYFDALMDSFIADKKLNKMSAQVIEVEHFKGRSK